MFDAIIARHPEAVKKKLDKPLGYVFVLKATASDSGSPPRTTEIDVTLEVKESDNKPPSFVSGTLDRCISQKNDSSQSMRWLVVSYLYLCQQIFIKIDFNYQTMLFLYKITSNQNDKQTKKCNLNI